MAQLSFHVLLFADAAQTCGTDRLAITCPPGATVEHLLALVVEAHPSMASRQASLAVAVNECYVDRDHRLEDGDTVALIPPVSGG